MWAAAALLVLEEVLFMFGFVSCKQQYVEKGQIRLLLLLLTWRGKSRGDQPNSRCQQRLSQWWRACLLRRRSSVAFNLQLLYAVKPWNTPYEDQIYRAAFSHQALVEGLSVINDKLENGLKFIISMLSIRPKGLVMLWMSLESPGALQDFSASEIWSS